MNTVQELSSPVVQGLQSSSDRRTPTLLPPHDFAGRASDNIAQLKRETMSFMTSYMQAQKMDTEEGEGGGGCGLSWGGGVVGGLPAGSGIHCSLTKHQASWS